ncbi:cellulose binding domain-containing protein [Streptomyces yaizuensis]|uniref:Hydrolase n=1 Tax=Streptomyces yaizuensis TaxID=2989713 RepID=A0ABQ5PAP2_9ACTN|nr:cellulose binding domain-containing protein [Streptomyces sp. YSPA8]GLF99563.1 hydrolase [Streptomyces sp. YSPA8]
MRRTPHRRLRTALAGTLAAALAALGLAGAPGPAAAAAPALTVQYRAGATGATAQQAAPWFTVRNTGTAPVRLADVRLRYYFTADAPDASYRFSCDWAVRGCSHLTGSFAVLTPPVATADRYLEIGFSAAAGSLAPGADSGEIRLRFHRGDWKPLRQSDDHSFAAERTTYADWDRVTAHLAGATVWGTAPGGGPVDPPPGAALFDDFAYTAHDDPRLAARGWALRSWPGGPGVPGATWSPQQISFAAENGSSVLRLRTETTGTAATTRQAEILNTTMKFRKGTYAARVRFSDAPVHGPDGDHVIQTFFAINDLKAPMADDYAEYDFEYLPNGGWGESGNTLFATSWETYDPTGARPPVNQHTADRAGHGGWRDLVFTIDDTAVRYYVDGRLFATHDAAYLPERPVLISFNQWLTGLAGQPDTTTPRAYEQGVDYVLHVKDQVLTPAQVTERVAAYRAAGTAFEDTVPAP